eukprot:6268322-Amphidinium_carterae.1
MLSMRQCRHGFGIADGFAANSFPFVNGLLTGCSMLPVSTCGALVVFCYLIGTSRRFIVLTCPVTVQCLESGKVLMSRGPHGSSRLPIAFRLGVVPGICAVWRPPLCNIVTFWTLAWSPGSPSRQFVCPLTLGSGSCLVGRSTILGRAP